MSCYNGGWVDRPEDEREGAWVDSEGDLPFLPEQDWRIGDMTPQEKMFRDMIENDGDDGA